MRTRSVKQNADELMLKYENIPGIENKERRFQDTDKNREKLVDFN